MDDVWQELFRYFGIFTILIAAGSWLAKEITTHILSKNLTLHQKQLDMELEKFKSEMVLEVENYKNRLAIMAKENEIRFSKLHEKRAEILAELFSRLENAQGEMSLFHLRLKHDYDRQKTFDTAKRVMINYSDLDDFFRKNKLYVSKVLADHLEDLLKLLHGPRKFVFAHLQGMSDEDLIAEMNEWVAKSGNIYKIMDMIEEEFRIMLGSELPEKFQSTEMSRAKQNN